MIHLVVTVAFTLLAVDLVCISVRTSAIAIIHLLLTYIKGQYKQFYSEWY